MACRKFSFRLRDECEDRDIGGKRLSVSSVLRASHWICRERQKMGVSFPGASECVVEYVLSILDTEESIWPQALLHEKNI